VKKTNDLNNLTTKREEKENNRKLSKGT